MHKRYGHSTASQPDTVPSHVCVSQCASQCKRMLPEMLQAGCLAGFMALAIHMAHAAQALINARLGTVGQYCLTALLDGQ